MHDNSSPRSHYTEDPRSITGSENLDIDVVIAVHSATRPVLRAVESCRVESFGPAVRVTVVCHNISVQTIEQSIGNVTGVNLRYLHLDDGIDSPAGPKNVGLDAATADFVCMLDSDDYLEPGALGQWYQKLVTEQADVVIAPVRHEFGAIIKTPRARPFRTRGLDPVKDGLAYATSMRGLWKNTIVGAGKFRYVPGLRTGEDLAPGLQLYFSGAKFLFPKYGPAYVLGNSAEDRVTERLLPLNEEFQAIASLPGGWLQEQSLRHRESIAIKIARTSLIGAIRRRGTGHEWNREERTAVQETARFLEALAPAYRRAMPLCDYELLENCLAVANSELFAQDVNKHRHAKLPSRILTRKIQDNFHPESQLCQLFRALLDRRS